MFPYLFVTSTTFFLGNVIASSINQTITISNFFWNFYLWISDIIPILFFYYINGVIWYIGSTLIASFLLYPVAKKLKDHHEFVWVIASIALYSVLFVFCKQTDTFHITNIFIRYGFNVLRGISGISLGIFIYSLNIRFFRKKKQKTKFSISIICSIICLLFLLAIVIMPIYIKHSLFDILYILLFCFILFIMVSKLGLIGNRLSLPNPKFTSDYSLSLFLTHWVVGPIFNSWRVNFFADMGCLLLVYLIAVAYTIVIILFKKILYKNKK